MMAGTASIQETVEQYLQQRIPLEVAADALVTALSAADRKETRKSLSFRKPVGMTLNADDYARIDQLMAEVDRRAALGG